MNLSAFTDPNLILYLYGFVSCLCLASAVLVFMTGLLHLVKSKNKGAAGMFMMGALGCFFYFAYNLSFQRLLGSPVTQLLPTWSYRFTALAAPISLALLTLLIVKSTLLSSIKAYTLTREMSWVVWLLYFIAAAAFGGILLVPDLYTAALIGHWVFLPFCVCFAILIGHFFKTLTTKVAWSGLMVLICITLVVVGYDLNDKKIPWGEPWLVLLNLFYGVSIFLVSFGVVVYGYSGVVRYQHIKALDHKNVAHQFHEAILSNQFFLAYQPKVNLKSGNTESLEALIRWHHPKHGFIPPDHFIPLAEETGVIDEITKWVIDRAFMDLKKLHELGFKLSVAINFSSKNIHTDMVNYLRVALARHEVDASDVIVEITERFWIYESEDSAACLEQIKSLGFTVSLDDFGTGQSSLQSFHNMQFNEIKIDQSFVRTLTQSKHYQALVQSMVELSSRLELQTVIEGVEDQESLELVKSYGASYAQGYGIAKPMELVALLGWLWEAQS